MLLSLSVVAALALSSSSVVVAASSSHHASNKGSHPARLAKQGNSRSSPTDEADAEGVRFSLDKRQASNARFTYYDTSVGLGACGQYHGNEEYTVALNSAQLNAAGGYSSYPPAVCGRSISIQWGGKTISATIQDECPTCPYGGLDLSAGLFSAFASHDVGVIYGTWWYNDGSNQPTTTKEEPKWTPPATTSTTPAWTPAPEPTTTSTTSSTPEWTPPPAPSTTTSTSSTPEWTPEPSTTSSTSLSSSAGPSSSAAAASSSAAVNAGGSSASLPSGAGSASASASNRGAFTLSGASPSASASSVGGAKGITDGQVLNDNLEKLGSLVDLMGKTICTANLNCEA